MRYKSKENEENEKRKGIVLRDELGSGAEY